MLKYINTTLNSAKDGSLYCIVPYIIYIFANEKSINMNTENVKSQMRKGILEYCTLLILSKQRAYVSDIIRSLKESRLIVVEGTLYPLLTRLKNTGLLTYEWVESTQGPPRKYYELTDEGKRFLSELEESWNELNNVINHIRERHTEDN